MVEYIIGIDPGKTGAMAAIIIKDEAKPQLDCVFKFSDNNGLGRYQALKFLQANKNLIFTVVIEAVGAMPGQGGVSMFTFGKQAGYWEGALEALYCSYIFSRPQAWQKVVDNIPSKKPGEKAYSFKKRRKLCVLEFVTRAYPDSGVKIHLEAADAVAIAHFGLVKRSLHTEHQDKSSQPVCNVT